ncbi:hypothetical protein ACIHFE_26570 [Streptomyces sp. NPDC052396]|uniref:hypothetical protein n=1 Tax=Streptomyces sp. NPDC052396 TaxID=3365689 RepID=UPI0037D4F7D0
MSSPLLDRVNGDDTLADLPLENAETALHQTASVPVLSSQAQVAYVAALVAATASAGVPIHY